MQITKRDGSIVSYDISKIKNALIKAFNNTNIINYNIDEIIGYINDEILNLDGISCYKTRHFYNNLLNTNDARYL